jgi:hypothetical protein
MRGDYVSEPLRAKKRGENNVGDLRSTGTMASHQQARNTHRMHGRRRTPNIRSPRAYAACEPVMAGQLIRRAPRTVVPGFIG